MCFKYITRWEEQGIGAQWSNLFDNPMPTDTFSVGWAVIFMIIDLFLYLILVWYFENVLPGKSNDFFFMIFFIDILFNLWRRQSHPFIEGSKLFWKIFSIH